jgi:glycosyltransferase involved in cell wall biosynthesis
MSLTPRHHLVDVDFLLPPGLERYRRLAMAVREVAFLLWLSRFVWRVRGSIVTATNPYLQGLNAAVLSRLLGIPYAVIITRDFDWDWDVLGKQAFGSVFPSRRIERAIGRWVLRHAHLVLADRRYYRDFAVRNGARPERAVATRVLADNAYAHGAASPTTRARFGLSGAPLLIYVGRLDADKFALDLVDCLAAVRERFPDAQLACAGTGALHAAMQQRARTLGLGDGLHLLGSVDLSVLPDLIASADVVVAPHMGYTLIEAGLTGVPIVTYDYDFHAEIIDNGTTGLLVPLRDVPALADAVCRILADPRLGQSLGERLRARLLSEHSLAAVVPLYRSAYDRALEVAA